jgi:hypothetical protein
MCSLMSLAHTLAKVSLQTRNIISLLYAPILAPPSRALNGKLIRRLSSRILSDTATMTDTPEAHQPRCRYQTNTSREQYYTSSTFPLIPLI